MVEIGIGVGIGWLVTCTVSERIVDPLVFLEMVDFLSDRVAVALADVGTENSSGRIRII